MVRIFARLSRADFRNANLADARLGTERNQFKMPKQTDLSGALFGGAELAGADFTGANIYGTVFKDAKGLAEVNGLDHAKYRDKAIF